MLKHLLYSILSFLSISSVATAAIASPVVLECEREVETCVDNKCSKSRASTRFEVSEKNVDVKTNELSIFSSYEVSLPYGGTIGSKSAEQVIAPTESFADKEPQYDVFANKEGNSQAIVLVGRQLRGGEKKTGQVWLRMDQFNNDQLVGGSIASFACKRN